MDDKYTLVHYSLQGDAHVDLGRGAAGSNVRRDRIINAVLPGCLAGGPAVKGRLIRILAGLIRLSDQPHIMKSHFKSHYFQKVPLKGSNPFHLPTLSK